MTRSLHLTGQPVRRRLPLWSVITLAWLSLLLMWFQHQAQGIEAAHHAQLGWQDFPLMLVMWWGMAIAMMLPTAIPALDTLEELAETATRKGQNAGKTSYFVAGFIFVWIGFGLFASVLQYILHNFLLLNEHAESAGTQLSAALFLLAGIYQWTPWKNACVSRCRAPMTFFITYWEEGDRGNWRMGLRMGKFCLGCCWAMMLLMFALGIMNLAWMGLLTLYMYAEKNWFSSSWIDRAVGAMLIAVGLAMLVL